MHNIYTNISSPTYFLQLLPEELKWATFSQHFRKEFQNNDTRCQMSNEYCTGAEQEVFAQPLEQGWFELRECAEMQT